MRLYCEEASRYGDVPVSTTLKPRNIAVILNPAANRRLVISVSKPSQLILEILSDP